MKRHNQKEQRASWNTIKQEMFSCTLAYWNEACTVSIILHRCDICECVYYNKNINTLRGFHRKFTIHHYVLAVKKYEATAGYNKSLRGQVGAVLLQLSTSAGLHNTKQINNCGCEHLPQTSCIYQLKNMIDSMLQ